ncbi:hypothetical protein CCH79_00021050, partial [Gambusia affinis]
MGIRAIFIALRLALSLLELTLLVRLPGRVNGLKQQFPSEQTSNTSGVTAEASSVKCSLQGKSRLPAFSRDGDFVIGGVATIHSQDYAMVYNYTTQPESPRCTKSLTGRGLRISRSMIFAIEEINNSTDLLPGIKLGYRIYDSCVSVPVSVDVASQLLNGEDPVFYKDGNCSQSRVVVASVGDSGSSPSITMSRIMGSFKIPLV